MEHAESLAQNVDRLLSKEDTRIIKGLAIILMLLHHLWGFPDRIPVSLNYVFTIFEQSSIVYIGMFGKICVSIFFFVGGYGTYLSSLGKKYDIVNRIGKLYGAYWKVFAVFIPIAFLLFSNQPAYCEDSAIYSRFVSFSWQEFWGNFLGVNISYNREWWFLSSYVVALCSFPMVRMIAERHSAITNACIIIFASILVTNVLPFIGTIESIGNLNSNFLYSRLICQTAPYVSSFWMGIVTAKDGLLEQLKQCMAKSRMLNPFADIAAWWIIIYLRQSVSGDCVDIFYIPVLIVVTMDLLQRLKACKLVLLKIGQQSTNMWLIHSFFCYYFYAVVKLVVAPKWAVPSLLILIALTYVASLVLTCGWDIVFKMLQKIKPHRV